ncbi:MULTISPECIES: DUF262 domain-containing protein [Enterobacter cloacae complex]|uniref:DUF262 domain-containing protein n=1 Tax=Enterobacter cloacae complex TaxID=354276 RepID=UPI0032FC8626|nr:DUF262 domain-containing protein [Enterobacter bugandensis]
MKNFKVKEDLALEGLPSGVESEPESDEYSVDNPFNPDSISIKTKVISLDTVLRRIKTKTIVLSPDFQREEVWDHKRKSQLIESMILRIPLPMFYVAEDNAGVWEVVDGLQRLSTIRDFVLGDDEDGKGFKLQYLEFLSESLDKCTYFQLEKNPKSARVVNNIMETELSFTIIEPGTPENVKRNIFRRINTGGMRLSEQEIRNALYQGRATKLLKEMVSNPYYLKVTGGTVKDNRMAGRELILRFVAFNLFHRKKYAGDIDSFLSDAMMTLNENLNISTKDIIQDFETGLIRAYEIFGLHSFRKSMPDDHKKAAINKSLFEVWINVLSEIDEDDFELLVDSKEHFLESYEEVLYDEDFSEAISRRGATSWGCAHRYTEIVNLIQGYLI